MPIAAMSRLARLLEPAAHEADGEPAAAGGSEQRAAPRHDVVIHARLTLDGAERECTIRNVSTTGMTVAAPGARIDTGQQVVVVSERLGTLYGMVRWARDGVFGLQFPAPIALDTVYGASHRAPEGMRPRAGRARTKLPASVHFGPFHRRVEIGNISVGGLMMVSRLPLRPAQSLTVELDGMAPIGGHVRWCSGVRSGVMFTKLLPIASAEEIARIARLGEGWLEEVRAAHRATIA